MSQRNTSREVRAGKLKGEKIKNGLNKRSRTILLVSKKTAAQIMEERRKKSLAI